MSGYLNQNILINLGTDFNVNIGDNIVLSNNNETCKITDVEEVDSNYSLVKKKQL